MPKAYTTPILVILLAMLSLAAPTTAQQGSETAIAQEIARLLGTLEWRIVKYDTAWRIYRDLASCSTGQVAEESSLVTDLLSRRVAEADALTRILPRLGLLILANPSSLEGCSPETIYWATLLGLASTPISTGLLVDNTIQLPDNLTITMAATTVAEGLLYSLGRDPGGEDGLRGTLTIYYEVLFTRSTPCDIATVAALPQGTPPKGSCDWSPWPAAAATPQAAARLLEGAKPEPLLYSGDPILVAAGLGAAMAGREDLFEALWQGFDAGPGACSLRLGQADYSRLAATLAPTTGFYECGYYKPETYLSQLLDTVAPLIEYYGDPAGTWNQLSSKPTSPDSWSVAAGDLSLMARQAAYEGDPGKALAALEASAWMLLANPTAPVDPYSLALAANTAGLAVDEVVLDALARADFEAAVAGIGSPDSWWEAAIALAAYNSMDAIGEYPSSGQALPPFEALSQAEALAGSGDVEAASGVIAGSSSYPGSGEYYNVEMVRALLRRLMVSGQGLDPDTLASLYQSLYPAGGYGTLQVDPETLSRYASQAQGAGAQGNVASLLEMLNYVSRNKAPTPMIRDLADSLVYGEPRREFERTGLSGLVNLLYTTGVSGQDQGYGQDQWQGPSPVGQPTTSIDPETMASLIQQLAETDPELARSIIEQLPDEVREDILDTLAGTGVLEALQNPGPAPGLHDLAGGLEPPSIGLPTLEGPGIGGSGLLALPIMMALAALLLLARRHVEVALLARRPLRQVGRRGPAQGRGGAGESVVELYAALLAVLSRIQRPKRLSETHREYDRVLRGEARRLHSEAMRIYERVKFGMKQATGEDVSTLRRILDTAMRLARRG